ncbi:TIGR04219 family outer membrane beta-barrel protein [Rheinheimera sp.]|uniref:TIGR04219 family outer membrane beta-barrel protein n=1 Tax=Rheinheimera sp. TaxID=1869214 RepID=UPI00307FCBEB
MKFPIKAWLCTAALMSPLVWADTVAGVYLGADYMQADVKGGFGQPGAQQDFNFADKDLGSFMLKIEHPVPLMPNIRLQYNNLKSGGSTVLNRTFVFDGQQFDVASTVMQDADLSNIDATFYYELLDNELFAFDLGVTAKYIDGELSVVSLQNGQSARQTVSAVVPMLYSYGSFGLLGTGVTLFAEANYASYDGSSLSDIKYGLSYELVDVPAFDLQFQAGFKRSKLQLDDVDDLDADLTFDGAFAGVQLHF